MVAIIEKREYDGWVVFSLVRPDERIEKVIDGNDLLRKAFEDGVYCEDEHRVERILLEKLGGVRIVMAGD